MPFIGHQADLCTLIHVWPILYRKTPSCNDWYQDMYPFEITWHILIQSAKDGAIPTFYYEILYLCSICFYGCSILNVPQIGPNWLIWLACQLPHTLCFDIHANLLTSRVNPVLLIGPLKCCKRPCCDLALSGSPSQTTPLEFIFFIFSTSWHLSPHFTIMSLRSGMYTVLQPLWELGQLNSF